MQNKLQEAFTGIYVNGDAEGNCLYTVLNVGFPKTERAEMLLFNLDMAGICISGGSACSSGASSVSHVISALYNGRSNDIVPVRFSFSRHNTKEEVDTVIEKLKSYI